MNYTIGILIETVESTDLRFLDMFPCEAKSPPTNAVLFFPLVRGGSFKLIET